MLCIRKAGLSLEGDRGAELVRVGRSLGIAKLGGVEGQTEGGFDAWSESLGVAEAEDSGVVDLGLDKGGVVKVGLGTDLEVDAAVGALGVVGGSGTRLSVSVDAVVVAGRIGAQVAEAMEGNRIVGRVEASTEVVPSQLALLNVVAGFGTSKESITTENSIGSESGTLQNREKHPEEIKITSFYCQFCGKNSTLMRMHGLLTLKRSRCCRV
jgi:hypothetical protein